METRFYKLSRTTLATGVAKLASVIVSRGMNLHVQCSDQKQCEAISEAIWREHEFLPHAVGAADPYSKISISTLIADAKVLIALDSIDVSLEYDCERICLVFHAQDADIVASRRIEWKKRAQAGHSISYWAESETGAWEKQAEENTKS